jgi:type II secretory pathway component PulJ
MSRVGAEEGFTLMELLIGMVITVLLFSAVLTALDIFMHQSQVDQTRNEVQDNARTAIDRLSRQLRNVASASATTAGALEVAGPYDIVFQTVTSSPIFGGQNGVNQERVRYCLDDSTPSNETLWTQTQTWTSAAPPTVPSTGSCPAAISSGGWQTRTKLVTNVTNQINNQSRVVFTYAPLGSTTPAQINFVDVNLFLNQNPNNPPGETNLQSGIYLRNSFAAPIARFTVTQPGGQIALDATASSDPNGQALSYQWSVDGHQVFGATGQQWVAGTAGTTAFAHGSVHTFTLTVTSTAGFTATATQTVTIV